MTRKEFLATLAGLGLSASRGFSPARAADPVTVTVMTAEVPQGLHAPIYLAMQKGWFRDGGLNVSVKDGRGSANTVNLVGAGQIDFGYANLGAMAIAAAKGVPVVAVASLVRLNTSGLVMLKDKPLLKTQADVRGKEILYNTASIELQVLSGWLALGGMTTRDVKLVGLDGAAKIPTVVSGKGDAAVGPVPYYVGLLETKGGINFLRFADAGQALVDLGVMTSPDLIKAKPAVVRTFAQAVSKAFEYTKDGHVEEAVDAMIVLRPDAQIERQTAVNMFNSQVPYIYSKTTEGKPIGTISPVDFEDTVKTLVSIGVIDGKTKAADLYVTDFMPT